MRLVGLVLALVLLLGSGCAREVPPEEVAKSFYHWCEVGRQQGPTVVQREFYELLSADSRAALQACAERVQETLGEDATWPPEQCLIFTSWLGERGSFESERLADGDLRVRLAITSGEQTAQLELVQEEGWKVDLLTSIELNASGKPAGL